MNPHHSNTFLHNTNFQNDLSGLQALAKMIWVVVDTMPKYYAKFVGEGIEYSWGHVKVVYCQTLLQKKDCSNFVRLVQKCCSLVDELTTTCIRLLDRGA